MMNNSIGQTTGDKLDQVELMKQFIGTWQGEFGEGSIFMCENKAFSNGIVSESKIVVNGKTVDEIAQIYGYDAKADKFIIAELKESKKVIELCSTWFTSKTTGEIVITNPDDAPFRFTFEFKSPNSIEQIAIQNDKEVNRIVLKRIK